MIELHNIDCMEGMKQYPDKHFDLAICDPPYGIGEDGRSHVGRIYKKDGTAIVKIDKRNGSVIKVKPQKYKLSSGYDDKHPTPEYFNQLFRVSKFVIIWGENYMSFYQKEKQSGRIIWDKVNGGSDQSDAEIAFTNCHDSVRIVKYMWSGMLQGKSLSEPHISQGDRSKCERRIHPNHKPILLYKWLLTNYAKPGDKILDTHLGSGSIALACHELKFDLVGYEIDKDYFDAAQNRLKNFQMQATLF